MVAYRGPVVNMGGVAGRPANYAQMVQAFAQSPAGKAAIANQIALMPPGTDVSNVASMLYDQHYAASQVPSTVSAGRNLIAQQQADMLAAQKQEQQRSQVQALRDQALQRMWGAQDVFKNREKKKESEEAAETAAKWTRAKSTLKAGADYQNRRAQEKSGRLMAEKAGRDQSYQDYKRRRSAKKAARKQGRASDIQREAANKLANYKRLY